MKSGMRVFAALALAVAPAFAQVSGNPTTVKPARSASTGSRADSALSGTTIVVSSEPNSVRLIAIPVPAQLIERAGRFEFARIGTLSLGGRLSGTFSPGDAARPVVLNVAVPTSAPAGRLAVGLMRFTANDGTEPVDVAVFLDIQARASLQVEPSRSMVGTHSGAKVTVDLLVRNTGNAAEDVTISLQMPNNWRSRVLAPLPAQIAAGATNTVPVELSIAADAEMGDYSVVIRAASLGAEATSSLIVRVGAGQNGAIGWRPMLEANAAIARDADGKVATAYGAELSGEVYPDVRANGSANYVRDASALSSVGQRSLGRLGYSTNRAYLLLAAPHWEGGVGMLGVSNAGLAGTGLWGNGATARSMTDDWRASVLDVQPTFGGHFLLGDASHRIGRAWTGVLASDLHDDAGVGRTSQTLAGTVTVPWRGGGLEMQAGRRSADSLSGFAWSTQLQQRTRDWSVNALASHSPGGATAFARAEDEFQLDGFRKLNSFLSVGANYWNSRNGTSTSSTNFTSSGWAMTQQLALGHFGALSFDTHASTSDGRSTLGDFGNGDREVKATWSGTIGNVQTRLGASRGTLDRNSNLADGIALDVSATRIAFFGAASVASRFGSWQLDAANERTGVGVGLPAEQVSVGARVDQVPLVPGRLSLRAEVLTYYLRATNVFSSSQVVGVEVRVGDEYKLTFDAERNDFQRAQTGKSPWVLSTRIRHAIGLPAIRSASMRGIVYADLNGNGKRDRGEQGMPGAIIHIDGDVVTADAQGRFAVGRNRALQVEVDPRSLPMGWMAGPRPLNATGGGAVELAVIPTAPVHVTIRLATTEGIDTANVHLEKSIIVLTDSAGRTWTGTPNARGELRFDALPAGEYRVSADLSDVGETLVLPTTLPSVKVEGGGAMKKVELPVSPRKIRISPPGKGRQVEGTGSGGSADAR